MDAFREDAVKPPLMTAEPLTSSAAVGLVMPPTPTAPANKVLATAIEPKDRSAGGAAPTPTALELLFTKDTVVCGSVSATSAVS